MATKTAARKPAAKKAAKSTAEKPSFDLAQHVTDQVLARIAEGVAPWKKSWDASRTGGALPRSLSSGKAYRGVNIFLLDMVATANGYASSWWGTYKQIEARGGQVRKGERGTIVVFWKRIAIEDEKTGEKKIIPMLRYFKVFNVDQADPAVEGTPIKVPAGPAPVAEFEAVEACELALKAYYSGDDAPSLRYGGDAAYFSPARDHVQMPERESFDGSAEFYGTWFHETIHSTGHASRLARPDLLEMHRFGDESYSREELTAELGAAMLSAFTGVGAATIDNSAAYLAHWASFLKDDPKAIIVAAGRAHAAVELILGKEQGEETEEA